MKGNRSPRTDRQLQALARTNQAPKTEKSLLAGLKNLQEHRYTTPRVSPELKVITKSICVSPKNERLILERYGVKSLTDALKKIAKGF